MMIQSGKPDKKTNGSPESWNNEGQSASIHQLKTQLLENTMTHWKLGFMAAVKDKLAAFKLGKVKPAHSNTPEAEKESQLIESIKAKIEKLRQK
jgi:hypothetical protein